MQSWDGKSHTTGAGAPFWRALACLLGLSASRPGSLAAPQVVYKFSSSILALTPAGDRLLVANPDSNSLTIVDTLSRSVIAEIPVGLTPLSVAVSPSGAQAYVANQGSHSLSVIALPAGVVTGTIPLGDRPSGVAASPDGRLLAVSETGDDRVRLLDAQGLETLLLIPVADRPYGLAFTPDSRRLLVAHLLSGAVTVLTVQPYQAHLPLVSAGSNAGVPEPLPASLFKALTPIIFSAALATWPQVAPAPGVAISADGRRAYLAQTMANSLGYNTGFDTSVFPKVSTLNLLSLSHQLDEHISLPETDRPVGLPWDLALAKGDQELWVVNSASNDLSVIDLSNPTRPRRQANIPVGDNARHRHQPGRGQRLCQQRPGRHSQPDRRRRLPGDRGDHRHHAAPAARPAARQAPVLLQRPARAGYGSLDFLQHLPRGGRG